MKKAQDIFAAVSGIAVGLLLFAIYSGIMDHSLDRLDADHGIDARAIISEVSR